MCSLFCLQFFFSERWKPNIRKKKKNVTLNRVDKDYIKKIKYFIPPIEEGKVIKVYDGDTITIISRIPGLIESDIYKFTLRLSGIDCPEIRSKIETERKMAIFVRDKLSEKIMDKNIKIYNLEREKYGRILCNIKLDNIDINNWLLKKHYAIKYDGKKRNSPGCWESYIKDGE